MQFSTENEKKIIIIASVAIGIVFLYSLSLNITGRLTSYDAERKLGEVEKVLNETRNALLSAQHNIDIAKAALLSCEGNLSYTNSEEAKCKLNLLTSEKSLEACTNRSETCQNDLSAYKSNYNAALSDYKSMAASSAASICCTFSDFQAGTIKNWQIADNKISCNAGNLTINCRTGESNI